MCLEIWSQPITPFEFHEGFLIRMKKNKNHMTNLKSALRTVEISLVFHLIFCHVKIVL